jgi:F-box/leucine-rich repeat protein 14
MDCKEVKDADVAKLAPLTKLRRLEIYSDKLTEAVYEPLKPLTNLRRFHLTKWFGDTGMATIRGWTRLQALEIAERLKPAGKGLTDAGAANLKGLTELRELILESTQITDAALDSLAPMQHLEKLDLSSCAQITDAGLAKLKGLKTLKKLELRYLGITDAGLASLKELPALEEVNVSGTRVTKDAAKAFQESKPKVKIRRD